MLDLIGKVISCLSAVVMIASAFISYFYTSSFGGAVFIIGLGMLIAGTILMDVQKG
jgi:hypothetical protein